MVEKAEKEVQERPFRILVVSQKYTEYTDLGEIVNNVNCLIRIYADNIDLRGEDFKKKYEIVNFFDTERGYNQLKIFIASGKFDLIHFSLHGREKVIIFSGKEQIPYEEFKKIFIKNTNIKAVILNICESAGMARQIAQNIEWVLGWPKKVILKDATEASDTFYTSLFADNSIEDSFRSVALNESIKPVIYKDSKRYIHHVVPPETRKNNRKNQKESPHDNDTSVNDNDNKVTLRKKLSIALISIGLILVLLIVPVNKILNPEIVPDTDSLQISFPPSGSRVERNETLKVDARLIAGRMPWVFILPPGGTEWWPQNKGTMQDDHWEFRVSFGNEIDSGRFSVLALIIQDKIAVDMQEWYDSQSRVIKSDPLSEELLRSFFWYEADTAHYYRIKH